jgi:hypothetical protein
MRDKKFLIDLAKDVFKNLVFLSFTIPQDHLPLVFLPINFLDEKILIKWKSDPPFCLYEYYSKSLHNSVNGFPVFSSFGYLSEDDWTFVNNVVKKLMHAELVVQNDVEKDLSK